MEYLWWITAFLFGAVVGSHLNVCIYRLPENQSIAWPSSRCPLCGAPIAAFDLVPIISYLILRGRCRNCGGRISPQYPLVELLAGTLFLLAAVKYGPGWPALRLMLLVSLAIPAAAIDWKHKIIPDKLNFAVMLLAVPLLLESKAVFIDGALGFVAGGGLLLLAAVVSRGGMGGGDIKLAAALGLLLGWRLLLLTLFIAFALGSVIGITMILIKQRRWKEPIPFGPYLALGAIIAALAGDYLLTWHDLLIIKLPI